jgi:hypothetical protein
MKYVSIGFIAVVIILLVIGVILTFTNGGSFHI